MRLLDNGGWGFAATTMLEAPPALSDLVEHLWIDDSRIHRTLPGNYRIVADITPHIIVNVAHHGNAVSATMSLVGARSRHLDVDTSRRALTVAVRLHPAALPRLGVRDAAQLTNGTLSLHELLPRSMSRIRQLARVVDGTGIADELCAHLLAMRRQPVDRRAELLFRPTREAASTAHGNRLTPGATARTLAMLLHCRRSTKWIGAEKLLEHQCALAGGFEIRAVA
jgi:hypothetical protein